MTTRGHLELRVHLRFSVNAVSAWAAHEVGHVLDVYPHRQHLGSVWVRYPLVQLVLATFPALEDGLPAVGVDLRGLDLYDRAVNITRSIEGRKKSVRQNEVGAFLSMRNKD